MSTVTISGEMLYLASIALGSIAVCAAGLLVGRLLSRRAAPARHAVLLTTLGVTVLSPCLLLVAMLMGCGWSLDVPRRSESTTRTPSSPRIPAETRAAQLPSRRTVEARSAEAARMSDFAATSGEAKEDARPPARFEVATPQAAVNSRSGEQRLSRGIVWQDALVVTVGLWAVGILYAIVQLGRGTYLLARLRRTLVTPSDARLSQMLDGCRTAVGTRRRVAICESSWAPAPLSFGLLRPVIVMPAGLSLQLEDEQLRLVLIHEAAHIARGDHWVALLERVTVAVLWWNYFLRRVNAGLARAREEICDDYAAGTAAQRRRLAEVLVAIAGWQPANSLRVDAATALLDDARDDLAGRVSRLVDSTSRALCLRRRSKLGVCAFAGFLSGLLALSTLQADDQGKIPLSPEQQALLAQLQAQHITLHEDSARGSYSAVLSGREASDEVLAELADFGKVHLLEVFNGDVTDAGLQSIGRLVELETLHLKTGTFTENGIAHLARLERLANLQVMSPHFTDACLAELVALPNLSHLDLMGTSLSDAGLQSLIGFPALSELRINGSRRRISDAGVKFLANLPRLARLTLAGQVEITDAALQELSRSESLAALEVDGPTVTDVGLRALATLRNLNELRVLGTGITSEGVRALQEASGLTSLALVNCPNLNDESLAAVGELTGLHSLALSGQQFTDAGLVHLQQLKNLTRIEIKGPRFTGAGLASLAVLPMLNDIQAHGERIGDEIFAPLNQIKNLRSIDIGAGGPTKRPRITDAGLSRLDSPSLEVASFVGTDLTEAAFTTLDALPNLRSAFFPWNPRLQGKTWNRHRRETQRLSTRFPSPQVARLTRPALSDTQVDQEKAIVAELKSRFGESAIQSSGHRMGESRCIVQLDGPEIDDSVVDQLARLPRIFQINLHRAQITDAGVARLVEIPGIEFLRIGSDRMTNAAIASFARAASLKMLAFSGEQINDAGLAALPLLANLEILELDAPDITDAGLAVVPQMPRLERLWIRRPKITDAGIEKLRSAAHLKDIDVSSELLTDQALAPLLRLENLESLNLASKQITDAGVARLAQAQRLRSIILQSPAITDASLQTLGRLAQLRTISLTQAQLTDEGLRGLNGLAQLQNLTLIKTRITGAGMRHLENCRALENLTLRGPAVSNALFTALERFPKLWGLHVGGAEGAAELVAITDEGLKLLPKFLSLRVLSINYARVTDAGLDPLLALPELDNVSFIGCPGVTSAGIDRLKRTAPSLNAQSYRQ